MAKTDAPKTLIEAIRYFTDEDVAIAFVANLRPDWLNGPVCPRCDSDKIGYLNTRRVWKCKGCQKQFSVKVGTIFEDSAIPLSKWLPAMWQIVNCKNGISSYELARALGVTQKSAWFMVHRLRLAMQSRTFRKLTGHVEVDETYVGGKRGNMHEFRRKGIKRGRSLSGKVAVMGLLERHGKGDSTVKFEVLSSLKRGPMQAKVREHVEAGSSIYSDAFLSYIGLSRDYLHRFIDHSESYAEGAVHTNGLENFWSLLKRSIKGTYVSVEPFHLFRYLDEQAFRFNHRNDSDRGRFMNAMRSILNRRLSYAELTGSELPQTC